MKLEVRTKSRHQNIHSGFSYHPPVGSKNPHFSTLPLGSRNFFRAKIESEKIKIMFESIEIP